MRKFITASLALLLLLSVCSAPAAAAAARPAAGTPAVFFTSETTPKPENPDPLDVLLNSMTTEEKVGQMFFAQWPYGDAAALAASRHLGGYLMMGKEFRDRTPDEVRELVQECQSACRIPLLLGVDEEGGEVTRVSSFPAFREEPFLSPRELYSEGGFPLIESDAAEKSALLISLGINLVLAPVCDLSDDPDHFIYSRSFGADPALAGEFVSLTVRTMQKGGCGCVLKHFPGYGGNADTHTGSASDGRALSVFREADFLPFQAGIEAGAGAVMVSHNIMTCVDKEHPASLSPAVHALLREELSFEGVIMTDDLTMGAVGDYTDAASAAVEAVLAGNDLICCSDFEEQIPAVLEAVENGTVSMDQIDQSVRRILLWKQTLGLIP